MVFLLEELGFEGWLGVSRERAFWVEGTASSRAWKCESKKVGCVGGRGASGSLHVTAHLGLVCQAGETGPYPEGSGEPWKISSKEETWSDL